MIMTCWPYGAKPLSEPMPGYCSLDSWEQISANQNQNTTVFIQENGLENIVCQMVAPLSWPQCAQWLMEYTGGNPITYLHSRKVWDEKWGCYLIINVLSIVYCLINQHCHTVTHDAIRYQAGDNIDSSSTVTWGHFSYMDSTSIPPWISNYIQYNMWDEITYPFPNFNGATVEVWEWISDFIPHFNGRVIMYPCCV